MDQDSVKLGLLMETAQTHQKLAETAIEKLSQHTQSLRPQSEIKSSARSSTR